MYIVHILYSPFLSITLSFFDLFLSDNFQHPVPFHVHPCPRFTNFVMYICIYTCIHITYARIYYINQQVWLFVTKRSRVHAPSVFCFSFFFTFFIQIKYTNNTRGTHVFKPRYFPLICPHGVYRDIILLVINSSNFSGIIFILINVL